MNMARSRVLSTEAKNFRRSSSPTGRGSLCGSRTWCRLGEDRAHELAVLVGQEGIQRDDRGQAAIDCSGLEALFGLRGYEAVDVAKCELVEFAIAHEAREDAQIILVVSPCAGIRTPTANPMDEAFDLGEHVDTSQEQNVGLVSSSCTRRCDSRHLPVTEVANLSDRSYLYTYAT